MFELYDFRSSHFSEKARWALDFKGIPYTPRHLLPGFHMRTARKLAPRSCVPIPFAPIRRAMTQMMHIDAASSTDAERRFLLAFDRLDKALERGPFLIGDRFSRADLTACALLWPLCRPGESESEVEALFPPMVYALRKQLQHRRFYRWVLERYQENRIPARPDLQSG